MYKRKEYSRNKSQLFSPVRAKNLFKARYS